MAGEKYFVSWSGGKDSYLSLLKARKAGLKVEALLTFVHKEGASMSHGFPLRLMEKQALLIGLPLYAESVTWEEYEDGFFRKAKELKEKGFSGGIFGDINIVGHRQWVEESCRCAGLKSYLPLWGMQEEEVLGELLDREAELLVVALRADMVDSGWLGKTINKEFVEHLRTINVSPCGENGEYHTLVLNGPLFKERLPVNFLGPQSTKNHLFLDYEE